jgi:hypothetical protein
MPYRLTRVVYLDVFPTLHHTRWLHFDRAKPITRLRAAQGNCCGPHPNPLPIWKGTVWERGIRFRFDFSVANEVGTKPS